MTTVKRLYALQELDLNLDRLGRALAEAEAELKTEISIENLEAALKAEDARLEYAQTRQHDNRMETAVRRERAESLEARLYDGSVVNARDLEPLQQEADSVRRLLEQNEALSLELTIEIEDAQSRRAALSAQLAEAQERWQARREELTRHIAQLSAEQQECQENRNRMAAQVEPPLLQRYETLRQTKGGRAVAKVERDLCQGCRMSLPTQLRQRVRSGRQAVNCSSCGRMLFAE